MQGGMVERGRAYLDKQDYAKALADLNQAVGLSPDNSTAYFQRARVHYVQKNYDACIADNTKTVALDPGEYVAYHNRGLAYFSKSDYPAAIADYTRTIEKKPDYRSSFFQRARALRDEELREKHRGQHEGDRARSQRRSPLQPRAELLRFGTARARARGYQSLALPPNDAPRLQRGNTYSKLKLFQMAITDYTAVLAIEPKNAYQSSLRALNRAMAGQMAEAVANCDAALAAQPDNHGVNETCGMVSLKAGDLVKALARFEKAQTTATATDAQPGYGRALVILRQSGEAAAKPEFDKALAIDAKIARLLRARTRAVSFCLQPTSNGRPLRQTLVSRRASGCPRGPQPKLAWWFGKREGWRGRGIRTRYSRIAFFQDRRLQPLGHPSACTDPTFFQAYALLCSVAN